jgi:cobalamin-dependent methionine synthase I
MKLTINDKEVLRYLGYRGAEADERVSSLIAELIDLFSANVIPKNVYGIWDCKIDSSSVTFGGMTVKSENLACHLANCRQIVLLAATLGTQADTLIRRLSVQDMEKAVIAQALCAAILESYCDSITDEIALHHAETLRRKEKKESYKSSQNLCASAHPRETLFREIKYPTTRFSPGYGDFDIAYQKDILNLLNSSRIGLTLTEGYMLTPTKSVTAVIGFSKERKQVLHKCAYCAAKECVARKAV